MLQLRRLLTAGFAVALLVAPVVTACGETEMACHLAMTNGCKLLPTTGVMAGSPCHQAESDLMECCERDTEVVAAPLDDGSPRTLEAPRGVAHLPKPNPPQLTRVAAGSSPPRSRSARYLLLESFLL